MVAVGEPAPAFTLPDHLNRSVTLSKLRGTPVLLAFYPAASVSIFGSHLEVLDRLVQRCGRPAQVFGVSVDGPFANGVFHAHHELSFPLLSDYRLELTRACDLVLDGFMGHPGYEVARLAVLVVNAEGVVVHRWVARTLDEPVDLTDTIAAIP